MYGTIRMHQEREYPGRVSGTELKNPDFAAYARAFGGHGETVEKTEDFAPAFERAAASGKPALIELRIDPEAITPRRRCRRSGRKRARQFAHVHPHARFPGGERVDPEPLDHEVVHQAECGAGR